MKPFPALVIAAFATGTLLAQTDRWEIEETGGIRTDLAKLTQGKDHADHIEMAGRSVNAIIRWKISAEGRMDLDRWVRWPMLREKKDDTHAAANAAFRSADEPRILVDGTARMNTALPDDFNIHGMLAWTEKSDKLTVTRTIFPAVHLPCLLERWEIRNDFAIARRDPGPHRAQGNHRAAREIPLERPSHPHRVDRRRPPSPDARRNAAHRHGLFQPSGKRTRALSGPRRRVGCAAGLHRGLEQSLVLQTGNPAVDRLFAFSKLRAAENVLATRGGLMHAPGGFNRYLAAIWCNDQNEYVSPFFPFLGDAAGNESARNAYQWFAKFMNPEFRHIPSSVVAEGRGTWGGAGDRGDAAMTAYGASRWALATGDETLAREVWPFIEWCLEFCERKKTADGVIASDRDELEGRFSAGKTNLATSTLTYDALLSSAHLAEALGEPAEKAALYRKRAAELESRHRESLRRHRQRPRNLPLPRRPRKGPLVDLPAAHHGHLRSLERHHRCPLLARPLDQGRPAHRGRRQDLLGSLHPLRPARRLPRR